MKTLLIAAALSASTFALNAQTKWVIDPVHSSVNFNIEHLVISEVEGKFKTYEGSISAAKPDLTDAVIDFAIDVNSIDTDNDMRDKHLIAPDFFDAAKYPKMTFKSTSFKKVSGNKYVLNGNLTIHGITKPAKFDVTYGGTAKDGYGNIKAGFKAKGAINRFDYGLKYNSLTEAGGATLGKEVEIDLKLQFAKAK
ncbi:MAG: YceI family protein [Sphingobacteriaceae bacterium]|nr:YceI family protein [Sphingobacteriaceae bacterium]